MNYPLPSGAPITSESKLIISGGSRQTNEFTLSTLSSVIEINFDYSNKLKLKVLQKQTNKFTLSHQLHKYILRAVKKSTAKFTSRKM